MAKQIRFNKDARRQIEPGANILADAVKVTLHTVTYSLSDFGKALGDLDNGRVRGRAILVP